MINNNVCQSVSFGLELVLLSIVNQRLSVYLTSVEDSCTVLQIPSFNVSVENDCNLDHAVKRKVSSITGVVGGYVEQVKTVGNATRRPDCWSISTIYSALISSDCTDRTRSCWYDVDRLPAGHSLVYDHQAIINSCVKRFRTQTQYTSLPMYLLTQEFTVYELQKVYEIILGSQFDNKSFRRRFIDAGLLIPLDKRRHGCNRPAQLYRVAPQHVVHHFSRKMLGSLKYPT